MALKIAPRTVFVPKPPDLSYGEGMSRLRTWLDTQKIQSAGFKLSSNGRIGFEISFPNDRDAEAFETFDWAKDLAGQ